MTAALLLDNGHLQFARASVFCESRQFALLDNTYSFHLSHLRGSCRDYCMIAAFAYFGMKPFFRLKRFSVGIPNHFLHPPYQTYK